MRLMVQQIRYLRSISCTPILSAKCCVKKCGLYSGKYGNVFMTPNTVLKPTPIIIEQVNGLQCCIQVQLRDIYR